MSYTTKISIQHGAPCTEHEHSTCVMCDVTSKFLLPVAATPTLLHPAIDLLIIQ